MQMYMYVYAPSGKSALDLLALVSVPALRSKILLLEYLTITSPESWMVVTTASLPMN